MSIVKLGIVCLELVSVGPLDLSCLEKFCKIQGNLLYDWIDIFTAVINLLRPPTLVEASNRSSTLVEANNESFLVPFEAPAAFDGAENVD